MTERNELNKHPMHAAPLLTRALQGAGVAAVLVILFFWLGGDPNPNYLGGSRIWMVLPLILVPAAGALGGPIFYLADDLRYQGGWKKNLANIISILAYCLLLVVTFALAMNGPN